METSTRFEVVLIDIFRIAGREGAIVLGMANRPLGSRELPISADLLLDGAFVGHVEITHLEMPLYLPHAVRDPNKLCFTARGEFADLDRNVLASGRYLLVARRDLPSD